MTVPEIKSFHIATVVRDLEAAMSAYKRLLDAQTWRVKEIAPGFRVAYGNV